jgi:hypothetical protein
VSGLSGCGKSALLRFLAQHVKAPGVQFVYVDCRALSERTPAAFLRLLRHSLGHSETTGDAMGALNAVIERRQFEWGAGVCLLLDDFEPVAAQAPPLLYQQLIELREAHPMPTRALTYVAATRHSLRMHPDLVELFHAHRVWLGALNTEDALWSARRFAEVNRLAWDAHTLDALVALTRGYPAFLRAACEAHAEGAAGGALDVNSLADRPRMQAALDAFWASTPTEDELSHSHLDGLTLLKAAQTAVLDLSKLTAKERALLNYLQAHAGEMCEASALIDALWPEDDPAPTSRRLRSSSLAQLVQRLRDKLEADPQHPRHIHDAPGHGYRYTDFGRDA